MVNFHDSGVIAAARILVNPLGYTPSVNMAEDPAAPRMTRRRWIILHVAVILLIAYVSSYFYVSRQRFREYQGQLPGFLYVSLESLRKDPEGHWRVKHTLLAYFYAPINTLDRDVFGGPSPWLSIVTTENADGTSGPPKKLRIPTWIGMLLILGAVIVAGLVGLVLERLTAPPLR
jgi:hypothetical protein